MEEITLITEADPDTGWPILIQRTKNSSTTFRLDPGSNRYFYLSNVSPKEWTQVSEADTPSVEADFRKAYVTRRSD